MDKHNLDNLPYIYAAAPPAKLSGAPLCTLDHATALKNIGVRTCLVLCEETPLEAKAQRAGVQTWNEPLIFKGLRSGGIFNFFRHIGTVLASRWRYVRHLSRFLKKQPGILHIHSLAAHTPYALLAAWMARIPRVVTIHEPWAGTVEQYLDIFWLRLLANHVVCLSRAMVEQYPNWIGKLTVIHNQQVLPDAMVQSEHPMPIVGLVGRLGEKKGVSVFLQACLIWKNKGIVYEAKLIGPWSSEREYGQAVEFIQANGLTSHVALVGVVEDSADIYTSLDVLVSASTRDSFPRVVMEAMGYGIPVVATRVDGVPEMVAHGETGFLVGPEDPEALSNAAIPLLEDATLRMKMGTAGRLRAQELFSPDTYCSKMMNVYKKIQHTT